MFDRIAPRYDLLNRLLSAGTDVRWRRQCVDRLALAPGSRVLDLCTGTADLLLEWLGRDVRNAGAGVDLSSAMLVRGLAKLRRQRAAQPALLAAGDAERLPLQEETFDGAMVAFGIRNVGDAPAALREARRVLRPGGCLVVLEFSMPRGLLGAGYRLYFGRILPLVGGLISGDRGAYAYLPASVARFARPEEFGRLLGEAGFSEVSWTPLTAGIAHLYRGVRPS
jgi:demethylmenaquinone methyltransferase / 2-methoxy-6-polyprenyl-1,4-benzoquinol methylase